MVREISGFSGGGVRINIYRGWCVVGKDDGNENARALA